MTKRKPGPRPKIKTKLARGIGLSFPAEMADFLDEQSEPSKFIQNLIVISKEYQAHLKRRK